MKKEKRQILILIRVAVILSILLLVLFFIYFLLSHQKTQFLPYESESRTEKVGQVVIEDSTSIGWIQVEGTNIDYPVIYMTPRVSQTNQNYTWVKHRPTKDENRLVIFGHNIRNISGNPLIADESHERFEQLMSFVSYDFARENQYITYTREDGVDEIYAIYAVRFQDPLTSSDNTILKEETPFYIEQARSESLYDYEITVLESDTLLSLITCTRYFGDQGKTQFIVDARKLRDGEDTSKYRLQKTKNYDIIG